MSGSSSEQIKFYRFRSVQALLDWGEIEDEYIYLSPKDDLNDPQEGYLNLVFQGDSIVWSNFFKNYIFSLYSVWFKLILSGEEHTKEMLEDDIYVSFDPTLKDGMSRNYNWIFPKLCRMFFKESVIQKLIKSLSTQEKKFSQSELAPLMFYAHVVLLQKLICLSIRHGIISPKPISALILDYVCSVKFAKKQIKIISEIIKNNKGKRRILNKKNKQINRIISKGSNELGEMIVSPVNKNLDILIKFSKIYINKLTQLVSPDCYVASFATGYSNPLMWAHYGDSGKGACLIFTIDFKEGDSPYLLPQKENNRKIKCDGLKMRKVKYIKTLGERGNFNFFSNLCSRGELFLKQWFYLDGAKSNMIEKHWSFKKNGKKKYIKKIYRALRNKYKQYDYEDEYRTVILSFDRDDYVSKEISKWKYKFDNLTGIIFGVRTEEKVKSEIIRIINDKCKKYKIKNFNFYQAIDDNEGEIKIGKISL